MLCGEASLVNHHAEGGVAISMRCRAWTCEHCAPRRRAELIRLACTGNPTRLITLTVSPGVGTSPAHRASLLARAWRIVVARAKRQLKLKSLEYLAVFEATKRGEPHLHILVRSGYIPQAWLSQQMQDVLGSRIVDIRRINNGTHAARYVAKYIGKSPHRFATCKRYWQTRYYVERQPGEDDEEQWGKGQWYIEKGNLNFVSVLWDHKGREVIKVSDEIIYYGVPPPFLKERGQCPPVPGVG